MAYIYLPNVITCFFGLSECPYADVDNIANGEFKGDYIYTGHTEINCNDGYTLEGEAICEPNGFWRQPLPICQPVGKGDQCVFPYLKESQLCFISPSDVI